MGPGLYSCLREATLSTCLVVIAGELQLLPSLLLFAYSLHTLSYSLLYTDIKPLSRWTCVSDLFEVGDRVPTTFEESNDRDGADVFRKLHQIAKKYPDYHFWEQMAEIEVRTKGKRSRDLSLVLPEPEDVPSPIEELQAQEEPSPTQDQPRSKPKVKAENFIRVSFPGAKDSFAVPGKHSSSVARRSTPTQRKSAPKPAATISPKLSPHVKVEKKSKSRKQNVFGLNLRTIIEHVILEREGAAEISAILNDLGNIQEPEMKKLREYLANNEFSPQLIQEIGSSLSGGANESQDISFENSAVGDVLRIGRSYQLKEITNAEDLSLRILELADLYAQARRYEMLPLIKDITLKLQVSWNFYPGLSQLEPFLEVAKIAFDEDYNPPWDCLQDWILNFAADAFDLFTFSCSELFWESLEEKDNMKVEIFRRRSEFMQLAPSRYQDPPALFRSRGIEDI